MNQLLQYEFGLTEAEENRALKLHEESIIIDLLFQGPLSPRVISSRLSEEIKEICEPFKGDPMKYSSLPREIILNKAINHEIAEYKDEWYQSGITAGNRELDLTDYESMIKSMTEVQQQFDSFDWLSKALKAEDIIHAKQNNQKAGIITSQNTIGIGKNLELLKTLHAFGLRVLQLTYNNQDFVGAGCAEKSNAGLTNFGIEFVRTLNELGIVVDTGHCGKQTTLDACYYSTKPVIASHTGVESIFHHMRCKSDEEIKAIAGTGGVIGVFAMPWFIHHEPRKTTVDHVLDHIEYIINLVGIDHVGIGTDWPMSDVTWSLVYFKEHIAPRLGFEKGNGPSTETIIGFERYGSFLNFTRGLIKRGYTDTDIQKVLGENWLRVFTEVWGAK
ncbi:membrane dipeptidase [Bacillus sp. 165]|uniref:dipeptidase n=1 Tax=Bacillus sp. 165 TaxID=1529117 RepID=UPI001ADAF08E|nr:membrane dipeptidase [Bacillus sp. 165]MBO9129361.1 membrane dipeptidase [Bacillus sp. 165]